MISGRSLRNVSVNRVGAVVSACGGALALCASLGACGGSPTEAPSDASTQDGADTGTPIMGDGSGPDGGKRVPDGGNDSAADWSAPADALADAVSDAWERDSASDADEQSDATDDARVADAQADVAAPCNASTCPNGCCSGGAGGTCDAYAAQNAASCGTGGASCTTCPAPPSGATERCSSGACGFTCNAGYKSCGSGCIPTSECCSTADCASGQECLGGSCACDSTSCAQGCCDGNTCVLSSSQTNAACGTGGQACGACTGGIVCANGSCGQCSAESQCGSYGSGYMCCPAGAGTCIDTETDPNDCGSCGTVCLANETCSGGTCECASPYTLCGASCLDLQTDPENCGACGHSCLGGTCSSGECQPVLVAPNPTGYDMEAVATDGTYLYWATTANGGDLRKCALSNCSGTTATLASGVSIADALAIDNGNARVFGGTTNGLDYTTTSGGSLSPWYASLPSGGGATSVSIDRSTGSVYWTLFDSGTYATTLTGAALQQIMSSVGCALGVAEDASKVYQTDSCGNRLLACPLGSACGSSPSVILSNVPGPNQLYFDGTYLWMTAAGVSTYDPQYGDGGLWRCNAGGTSCRELYNGQALAFGVVSDGTNVYWTDNWSGDIMKSPVGGATSPTMVANTPRARDIVDDGNAIFWIAQAGAGVYMLAK